MDDAGFEPAPPFSDPGQAGCLSAQVSTAIFAWDTNLVHTHEYSDWLPRLPRVPLNP